MGTEIKGYSLLLFPVDRREDGSPSWGRKSHIIKACICVVDCVEKMGPRRGDGNNSPLVSFPQSACRREDGSSSRGRKPLRSIKVTKFYVM